VSKLGVLVSGSGSNLQALIDAVAAGRVPGSIEVVISNRAGVYALERAARAGIPTATLSHKDYTSREAFDAAVVERLRQSGVQWVICAGFMRIVTNVLLDAFPYRVINLHPSLLPAFPGVDSGRQAFEYGVKQTGCSVHFVTLDMDTGPLIAQTPVPILDGDTLETLMQRIHAAEHATLVDVVKALCEDRVVLEPRDGQRPRVRVRPAP
jgi:phosphoribosylglycinamide formyltransferase 1